jgi:hypothetical protein
MIRIYDANVSPVSLQSPYKADQRFLVFFKNNMSNKVVKTTYTIKTRITDILYRQSVNYYI